MNLDSSNWGNIAAIAGVLVSIPALLISQAVLIGLGWWQVRAKRKDDKLSAQLTRLNQQLNNLYGPLYAHYETGEKHWFAFLDEFSDDPEPNNYFKKFFPDSNEFPIPSEAKLEAYRLWTTIIFMPTNTRMETIIINHADLLVGKKMPLCFLEFGVHVAAFKPLIDNWSKNKFDKAKAEDHQVKFPHPIRFQDYVRASFEVLKREQSLIITWKKDEIDEGYLEIEIDKRMAELETARNEGRTSTTLATQ